MSEKWASLDAMLGQLRHIKERIILYDKLSDKDKISKYAWYINIPVEAFCSYACNSPYKDKLIEKTKELRLILSKGVNLDVDLLLETIEKIYFNTLWTRDEGLKAVGDLKWADKERVE